MAPLLAGILIIGIPAAVLGGIALMGGNGGGRPAGGGELGLPSNVYLVRSVDDVMALLSIFAQVQTEGGVGVGFMGTSPTPEVLAALGKVAREHPNVIFVAISEPASDAMGALEDLGPEDVGIDFRCPEGAEGLAGTTSGGKETYFNCWPPQSTEEMVYDVISDAAKAV